MSEKIDKVKKKKVRMFRFKGLIPFSILFGGIVIFDIFFLDSIVKNALIEFSEDTNKARVDIHYLDLKIMPMGIDVKGFQWTDSDNPLKNLFEFGELKISMLASQVFKKKFHIPEMSLTGLRFNTSREKSGELGRYGQTTDTPAKKESDEKSESKDLKTDFFSSIDKIDVKKIVDEKGLNFKEDADALQKNVDDKNTYWKGQSKAVSDTSQIKKDFETLKNINPSVYKDPKKIPQAKKEIQKIKNFKEKVANKKKEISDTRSKITSDVQGLKNEYSKIKMLKEQGLRDLLKSLKFSDENLKNISSLILGDSLTQKVYAYKGYYDRYSHYLPDFKGSDQEEIKEAKKGITVDFTGAGKMPVLFIKKINLSGEVNPEMPLSGKVMALSSDLSFKPMTFDFNGKSKDARFEMNGKFETEHAVLLFCILNKSG